MEGKWGGRLGVVHSPEKRGQDEGGSMGGGRVGCAIPSVFGFD